MTITNQSVRVTQLGNGATTAWSYTFPIPSSDSMVVTLTNLTTFVETVLTYSTDYTATFSDSGGIVTYSPALATGNSITIERQVEYVQETDLNNQDGFYPDVIEDSLDFLTMQTQQIASQLSRTLQLSTGADVWDAQGKRIINLGAAELVTDAAQLAQAGDGSYTGTVPAPTAPDIGLALVATGVGTFDWGEVEVAGVPVMVGDSGSGGVAGLVPAPAAGDAAAGYYLSAAGTWTEPPGTGGGGGGSEFVGGTRLLFQQTAAPTGWTKDTTYTQSALRVTSGSVSSGGSVDFTTAFASITPSGTVGSTTLTLDQIPAHTHDISPQLYSAGTGANPGFSYIFDTGPFGSAATAGGGNSHTHSLSMNAVNLAVKYVDAIIATKD